MLQYSPDVSTIAQTIQLSLGPVFMLAGIGALLNVLAGRLARIVEGAPARAARHPRATRRAPDPQVWGMRRRDPRNTIINWALYLAVSSAVMTCTVVAMLFVAELANLRIGQFVAVAFVLAMVLLITALVSFMVEVRISLKAIQIREELLR